MQHTTTIMALVFYFSLHEVTPAKVSLISFHLRLSPCAEIPKQGRSIYRAAHKEKAAPVEIAPFPRAKTQEKLLPWFFCASQNPDVFLVMDLARGLSGHASVAGQEHLCQLSNTINTNFAPWYTSSLSLYTSYLIRSKLWEPYTALDEMLDTQHSCQPCTLWGCRYQPLAWWWIFTQFQSTKAV